MRVAVRVVVQCVNDTNPAIVAEKSIAVESCNIYLLWGLRGGRGETGNAAFEKAWQNFYEKGMVVCRIGTV